MKAPVAAVLLLSILGSAPVLAGGINLSWDECGVAGQSNKSFACNTNSGLETLVISFEPDAPMSDFVGVEVALWLETNNGAAPFPDWWSMFNAGSCRGTSVPTVNALFPGLVCTDLWVANNAGGVGAFTMFASNVGRFLLYWATDTPVPVAPGTEYYAMNFVIRHTKTVGSPSCSGCDMGAGLWADILDLYGNSNTTQRLTNPRNRNYVCWQCPCSLTPADYGHGLPGDITFNCTTHAATPTWGAIKSLYR